MSTKQHFVDRIWLQVRDIISRDTSTGGRGKKAADPSSNVHDKEPFSITILAKNFQVLSLKARSLASIINSITNVFTWKRPQNTLLFLLLYTWACIYPHYFLIYPVFYTLEFLCHNYLCRHPIKPIMSHKDEVCDDNDGVVKLYHLSRTHTNMFGWLWQVGDSQDENGTIYGGINGIEAEDETLYDEISQLLESNENGDVPDASLLRNLYDIQVITSNVLDTIHMLESSIESQCSFVNEMTSTQLFLKLAVIIFLIVLLGPYIPWRVVLILSMWIAMLITHPSRKQLLNDLSKREYELGGCMKKCKREMEMPTISGDYTSNRGVFGPRNIIVDDSNSVKIVQVFEVQQQNIAKTTNYNPSRFMYTPFTVSDKNRKQRKLPKFTYILNDIKPPKNWEFVLSSKWTLDDSPTWIDEQGLQNEVKVDVDDWIYDSENEFRRRRLLRLCRPNKL